MNDLHYWYRLIEETNRRSYASLAELQDALFRYIHGL